MSAKGGEIVNDLSEEDLLVDMVRSGESIFFKNLQRRSVKRRKR